jgi:Carboxypeptidase regulatory-like domain
MSVVIKLTWGGFSARAGLQPGHQPALAQGNHHPLADATRQASAPPAAARPGARYRLISVTLACLVSILIVPLHCAAAPVSSGLLKGVVSDSQGAAIRGAHVIVRWDPAGADVGLRSNVGLKHEVELVTDKKGSFASKLPPGFYDVFVSATAFSPECRKIRIKSGLAFNFKVSLRVDPLVTRELGDTVLK